jgi:hypothetical protein
MRRPPRFYAMAAAAIVLLAANGQVIVQFLSSQLHAYIISRHSYKARYGSWQLLELPQQERVHAVHAALLQTGKVLIIAGSGNSQQLFARNTFKTLLWDPRSNQTRPIPTPVDMFCAGHAFLPDGRLLVAGGTQRYEALANTVTNAGGAMRISNESPKGPHPFPAGTTFVAANGQTYRSNVAITVPAARRRIGPRRDTRHGQGPGPGHGQGPGPGHGQGPGPGHGQGPGHDRHRDVEVIAGVANVWVTAVSRGAAGVAGAGARYRIQGLAGADARNLYGIGGRLLLGKEDFQGTNAAYIFDPLSERYDFVPPMVHRRWYPSLSELSDGRIIAVSGLDGVGQISDGHTEIFDPKSSTWSPGPVRYFPTYPALFLTPAGRLFYSGSNVGYGPAHAGRAPGIWDPTSDGFKLVPGLPVAEDNETSGSVLLPPAQAQRYMLLGGGGVGESPHATARTAIVDLRASDPHYVQGPSLPERTRYPLSVILPDDTVLVTGGAREYRGEHQSDNHNARIYHPDSNSFTMAASPTVGRDYHSEALLLPDGRVVTLGSNPLYADSKDTEGAQFEQRLEIYSPPYLFHGRRPRITNGPQLIRRAGVATFTTSAPADIQKIRLIHPSAATHDTDLAQRSIALSFTRTAGGVRVRIPAQPGLVPSGWYMLFADNSKGVPSIARWVRVA